MNIKIIGADCSNGMKLKKNLKKALKQLNLNFKINEISKNEKNKYGIINIPALIIDDKLINHGDVISERQIINKMKENLCLE